MLFVSEMYKSLQGESSYNGKPCSFIRLTGCHLRCSYCDSEHAFHGGKKYTCDEIVEKINSFGGTLVEVTGGEPLLQKETPLLLKTFSDHGYTVLLETSGSLSLKNVPDTVVIIMDIKCPSSQESGHFLLENLSYLKYGDEIKFVLSDKEDFDWALQFIKETALKHSILFSPVHNVLQPDVLAQWILDSKDLFSLDVRMQVQLHKYIWGENTLGV